jgi:hypothetical protein
MLAKATTFTGDAASFNFTGAKRAATVNFRPFKTPIPAQPHRGIATIPILAIDDSNGPNRGRLYFAYTDLPSANASPTNYDILFTTAKDFDSDFSTPVVVNDDATLNSHFNVNMDVDPTTGGVSLAWRDARNDPMNEKVDIYSATSADGGATFMPNVKISDNPSDMSLSSTATVGGLNDFLEYDGLATYAGFTYHAWSDNSTQPNGIKSVFFEKHNTGLPILGQSNGVGGILGNGANRFDPNDTADQAFFFGVLNGTMTERFLSIQRLPTGQFDRDWFRWTVGQSGTFTVSINYQNNSGDLHLRVFTQKPDETLVQLGSSRNLGVTSQKVTVRATAGTPILVVVFGNNGAVGDYDLTATVQ